MIYDIFDWYTTKIFLCYTWFFHCLSEYDDGVMLCDGLVHETTRFTSHLPVLPVSRLWNASFSKSHLFPYHFPKHFAVKFHQAKDTFYFSRMFSIFRNASKLDTPYGRCFSVVSAPDMERKTSLCTRSIYFLISSIYTDFWQPLRQREITH